MKLTADICICSTPDEIWRRTQIPTEHVRWDLRFTEIDYLPKDRAYEPQRFRYCTRLGGIKVDGWGQTIAARNGRSSALQFGSDDWKALIRQGKGCWIYRPSDNGIRFSTIYDYSVRWGWFGRCIDRIVFRPLMIWATRWSFDRLRLWLEQGLTPELSRNLWLLKITTRTTLGAIWIIEGLVPKILFLKTAEIEVVRRSGLYWTTPEEALHLLGLIEIIAGILIISGWRERVGSLASAVVIGLLSVAVVWNDPEAWADPYGGLVKNLGLWICSYVIWFLSPLTPQATRASAHVHPVVTKPPFIAALGENIHQLAPKVRDHFTQLDGVCVFSGVMERIWRRPGLRGWLALPSLWLSGHLKTLFCETGLQVPFRLEHVIEQQRNGLLTMTWNRTFSFPHIRKTFNANMHFDKQRNVIVDYLGVANHLEVELHPAVQDRALVMESGRQWMRLGCVRIRVPAWLAGKASVREWQTEAGCLGIRVVISNPLLGEFFGYEGTFDKADETIRKNQPLFVKAHSPPALSWPQRFQLSIAAFVLTAIYAWSFTFAPRGNHLAEWAGSIGVSAGIAWLLFGGALTCIGKARPTQWADICLRAMLVGNIVLLLSILFNVLPLLWLSEIDSRQTLFHLSVLLVSNLMMGGIFCRGAQRLNMPILAACLLWIGILDGSFILLLYLTAF